MGRETGPLLQLEIDRPDVDMVSESNVETTATAHDGVHVPLSIVYRKSTKLDDPRKDLHLAGAVYVQSRHCEFIS